MIARSLARFLLVVPILACAAASADAAPISFISVHDPADITLTVGGTESYSYTHDLAFATPSIFIPPSQVIAGTLAISLTDSGGSEDVLFRFDLGTFLNEGNTDNSETFSFSLGDNLGGTVLLDSLNADGKLNVTVRVGQQSSGQPSSFVFASSTLSGRADVAATAVPEPASLLLLGPGLLGLLRAKRRARA